jgi:hypothetical protein
MMGKELSEMTLEELWDLFPIYLVQHDDQWKAAKEYSTERHIGEEVITDIASFINTSGSDLYSPCENTVDLLPIQKYD